VVQFFYKVKETYISRKSQLPTLSQLAKKRLKIQRPTLPPYQQLLIEYIHIRDSRHQADNEKLAEGTFDEIQEQTLICAKEKTSE